MNLSKFLLLSLMHFVMVIPVTQALEVHPQKILQQAKLYKDKGELHKAYALLQEHQHINNAMTLQLALLANMLGKESYANTLFESLLANKDISKDVKRNIVRFRLKFSVSLQKQLRQAQAWSNQGLCHKAIGRYEYLLAFDKTHLKAKRGLKRCKSSDSLVTKIKPFSLKPLGLTGKVLYQVGQDSNIRAENQELLAGGESLLKGAYQFQKMELAYKWRANLMSAPVTITPAYDYSQKLYATDQANAYDRKTHRIQLKIMSKDPSGLIWRLPISKKWLALGGDDYVRYQQVSPSLSWPQGFANMNGRARIRWQLKHRQYENTLYRPRDGLSQALDYQLTFNVTPNIKLKPAAWYRHQSTRSDQSRAYYAMGIKMGAQLNHHKLRYSLSAQYGYFLYQQEDAQAQDSGGHARENRRTDIRGSISYPLLKNLNASFHINYAQQSSNKLFYEFDRLKSVLSVRFKF
mgnify:FL=1